MTAARTHLNSRSRSRGRSLLELMIAVVIGMVILGAVLLTSISGNSSGKRQDSVAMLNEDAQIAANLLGGHLRIAGYSRVVGTPSPTTNAPFRNYEGPGVRGCDGGVEDDNATMATMECVDDADGPDALMVAYEGDTFNTVPTAGAPTIPTDCLGQAVAPNGTLPTTASEGAAGSTYWLVENLFYVNDDNELVCTGNRNRGTEQPLIGNVMDMQVTYGVADVPTAAAVSEGQPETPFFEAARYLTAGQIDDLALFPATANPAFRGQWNRVVSVRVCLVLRSGDELYDKPTPYPGCNGEEITPPDRRAYRAVTITRAIKNKTAPCADAAAAPGAAAAVADRCAF